MATADGKLVTEGQPLTLHQHLKTLENKEERQRLFLMQSSTHNHSTVEHRLI